MNKKNKFKLIVVLLLVALPTICAVAFYEYYPYPDFDRRINWQFWNNPADNSYQPNITWYAVSEGEKEFCKKYGGTGLPQATSSGTAQFLPDSQITLTLQASKTLLPNGTYFYEVCWYIQPFYTDHGISYDVVFEDGSYIAEQYSANFRKGASDCWAQESTPHSFVTLRHEQGELTIPIVDITPTT